MKRGEDSFASGNVKKLQFDPELRLIRGDVDSSMTQRSYEIEVKMLFSIPRN